MLHHRNQPWVIHAVRNLDHHDCVIECTYLRWSLGVHRATLGVDDDVIRVNPNFLQHRAHQRSFVFAIAVVMLEHLASRVWLNSADSQFNGHVTDVLLNKLREGRHLIHWRHRGWRQSRDFLLYFWRRIPSSLRQCGIPASHLFPILEATIGRRAARRIERDNHFTRNTGHGGIFSSARIPLISLSVHCHWLLPACVGLTSG